MYRDSPHGLYREGYCKEIEGFINFIFSNPKNISGDRIWCPCVKCKKQKVPPIRCCDHVSSRIKFVEIYLCKFANRKPYIPYETMLEKTVGLMISI